jgi:hypothetical protein
VTLGEGKKASEARKREREKRKERKGTTIEGG